MISVGTRFCDDDDDDGDDDARWVNRQVPTLHRGRAQANHVLLAVARAGCWMQSLLGIMMQCFRIARIENPD